MPTVSRIFTVPHAATWREVLRAFQTAGIRVVYVQKDPGSREARVTFAAPEDLARADARRIVVRGQPLTAASAAAVGGAGVALPAGPHLARRPYAHIKVPTKAAELPITWHDGTAGDRISGELRCTLTALTPLLAANEQYRIADAHAATRADGALVQQALRQLAGEAQARDPNAWVQEHLAHAYHVPWFGQRLVHGERAVLEPLRDDRGRVLIPGEQLKGMVRQSIGALLGAPMERVREQTFSYRPNLMWPQGPIVLEPRPAVVRGVVRFRHGGRDYTVPDVVDLYPMERATFDGSGRPLGHRYRGGMEGWETTFSGAPALAKRRAHTSAEPPGAIDVPGQRIDPSVHAMWGETQLHLADTGAGHVSSRHPDVGSNAGRQDAARSNLERASHNGFAVGDVIFVEWDAYARRVMAYGHHYYYRWRYVDTIRSRFDPGAGRWETRPEVSPRAAERQLTQGRPHVLTGARALFGYAADNDGSRGIGEGDFAQLAGRIAFNIAVEQSGADDAQRFVGQGPAYAVSLQELGGPKPSAVEFYLDQSGLADRRRVDRGTVLTYGDLQGRDPPGDLGGRKFYRHNPAAATDAGQYTADSDLDLLNNPRAAVARFVSRPGTRFRFKVRFRDLDATELGVLLLALCPDEFVRHLPQALRDAAGARTDGEPDTPRYATKLGHGRPLGLGSVRVTVDSAWQLGAAGAGFRLAELPAGQLAGCVGAAARWIDGDALKAWLEIHDFRDSRWGPYPRHPAPNGEIYAFHGEIRKEHSRGRRQAP